jgi:hypothetical protein
MYRKAGIVGASAGILVMATIFAWPRISYRMLTGSFFPIHKVEGLRNPIGVNGWGPDGLILADGRTVQLPGFRSLPVVSPALVEATKRGVEIGEGGRVFGLIQIHHWCGNDPVREHIARVDLSDMMMFLHVGQTIASVPEADITNQEGGGKFTEWGWNVSEFLHFQSWQRIKDFETRSVD